MTTASDIAETLLAFGVWDADAGKRAKLAAELADDGATAADIETIGRFCEASAGHDLSKSPGRLVLRLRPAVWRDALKAARSAESRAPKPDSEPRPAPNMMSEEKRSKEAERQRLAGLAYTGMHFEAKDARTITRELGVSVSQLPKLLRQGAEQYGEPDPDAAVQRLTSPPKKKARKR